MGNSFLNLIDDWQMTCTLKNYNPLTIDALGIHTQCGNFRIFQSLRFYVKSILRIVKVKKSAIFAVFEAPNFYFWSISAPKCAKIHKKSRFRASKCVIMSDFSLQESPKLISHKIWVIEKFLNFHSVYSSYPFVMSGYNNAVEPNTSFVFVICILCTFTKYF